MLEFRFEWEDAPGVTSPVLAATWARIEIVAGGSAATRFWSTRSNSVRTAVHGSAFPLARMLARHFWSLLYEGLEAPELLQGARAGYRRHRAWLERHNLVLSREGMPYPDLTVYREVRLGRGNEPEVEDELAQEFRVSRKVIFHQLENHHLR
jgi:hypothetical protein